MKKWIMFFIVIACSVMVFAKSDQGKGHGAKAQQSVPQNVTPLPNDNPPGWDKGKKTGWEGGSEPPGLAKKDTTVTTPRTFGEKIGDFFDSLFDVNKK